MDKILLLLWLLWRWRELLLHFHLLLHIWWRLVVRKRSRGQRKAGLDKGTASIRRHWLLLLLLAEIRFSWFFEFRELMPKYNDKTLFYYLIRSPLCDASMSPVSLLLRLMVAVGSRESPMKSVVNARYFQQIGIGQTFDFG